jgi:hypothetical protein
MERPTIRPGLYRHFKGNLYEVIGVAQRVDSADWLVIYRPVAGDRGLVARPYSEFSGAVICDGQELPRFQFVQGASVECRGGTSVAT